MFLDDPQKKNNIIFSEDDYNQKYTINIPPQKPETTVDDIAVFLFTDYFVIWVRGTGKDASKRFYDAKKHIFSTENARAAFLCGKKAVLAKFLPGRFRRH